MDSPRHSMYARLLRFEPLESRRLLSITVDTLVDENNGVGVGAGTSLREAIAAATPGDTIDFSVTGTINLSVGSTNSTKQLTINKSLTISGPGASLLTIRAFDPTAAKNGDGSRVFTIDDGNASNLLSVSLSELTLTGGDVSAAGGGAIFSAENLVVTDCVISNSTTTVSSVYVGGGGILSQATSSKPNSLTVRASTLIGNAASSSEGGAIRQRYGNLVIEDSTITNNSAANAGGGVDAADNNVNAQISRSTISNNSVTASGSFAGGGGVFGVSGQFTLTDSTITGNSGGYGGGGVYTRYSTVMLTNCVVTGNSSSRGGGAYVKSGGLGISRCTISGNSATFGGGIRTSMTDMTLTTSTVSGNTASYGAGLYAVAASPTGTLIENSTISGNTASSEAAGIYNRGSLRIRFCTITANTTPAGRYGALESYASATGTITLYSTILAGNINGDIGYKFNLSPYVSLGYNLIGTGSSTALASFNKPGDHTGVLNPMLGTLANNGGPTKTHLPLAGSPAVDAGDPAAVAGMGGVPLYDQRGKPYTRIWDGDGSGAARIDIGAVELQTLPLPAPVYGDYNSDGVVDGGDYVLSRKTVDANVAPFTGADGSGNGIVGAEDYSIWRAHFGETYATGSGASIEGADVGRTFQISSIAGAPNGTAGREGSGTRVWALAEPVAPEVLREDALVAWVESAGRASANGAFEFEGMGSDSTESETGIRCYEALDVAVGELMSAALR